MRNIHLLNETYLTSLNLQDLIYLSFFVLLPFQNKLLHILAVILLLNLLIFSINSTYYRCFLCSTSTFIFGLLNSVRISFILFTRITTYVCFIHFAMQFYMLPRFFFVIGKLLLPFLHS